MDTKEDLTNFIQRAAAGGVKELEILGDQLKTLPSEFADLYMLKKRRLSQYKLNILPPEISNLAQLIKLTISDNLLMTLPPEIGQLTNLTTLDLNGNRLENLPPEIGQLTNLTTLDLRGNRLKNLPPEIGQLTNLTTLDLSGNRLENLPPEIGKLKKLATLRLTPSQAIGSYKGFRYAQARGLSLANLFYEETDVDSSYRQSPLTLPSEFWQLTNLRTLDLCGCGMEALAPEIGELTGLAELDLSRNELVTLPHEIGKLVNLTTLNLSDNELEQLPTEIGRLSKLKVLYFHKQYDKFSYTYTSFLRAEERRKSIIKLPPQISQLTNLTKLTLGGNPFEVLPPKICKLANLTSLDLSSTGLQSLPSKIGLLTNLTSLKLRDNELVTLPPEIWQLTGLLSLELSNNGIVTLPPEIGQLTRLEVLDLSGNKLKTLPPEMGELTNIRTINLSDNKLKALPPEMGELTNIKTIGLRNNELKTLPSEIGKLTKPTELNLSNNKLKALPPEIGQLIELLSLDLSYNKLTTLPPEIGQLTKLEGLNLQGNKLKNLPPEVGQLTGLTSIDLNHSGLATFPGGVEYITNITKLDLSHNELETLPPEIGQLSALTSLNLRSNKLMDLPAELCCLTNLESLDLRGNPLKALPPKFGQLTKLTFLAISGDRLMSFPPEIGELANLNVLSMSGTKFVALSRKIGQLKNLVTLELFYNKLTTLPSEIGQLGNLRTIKLHANEITSLPPTIGRLASLKSLSLSSNKLSNLPAEIGLLTNLTELKLCSNKLTDLPTEIGQLSNLVSLDLRGNELRALPVEIGQLTQLQDLELDDNPLVSPPPEVIHQGRKAALAYLQEQYKASSRQWVSKILFVGQGGAGKTSLLRALRREPYIEGLETTHGVEVGGLKLAHPEEASVTIELNTWDFGGQQIYHATHQFFLTNRSLFVLVWDARQGWEAGKLYYWLDAIQARAPESPVMLVATHIDERDADLPFEDLRHKYSQIVGHFEVSNKTDIGIDELREIIGQEAARLPLMGERWPTNWLCAASVIRDSEESYMSRRNFFELMEKEDVRGKNAEVLAQWLNELGDILYYAEDEELNDTVILNPTWVTEAISDVLESKEVIRKAGVFTRRHMNELWSNIEVGIREHLLLLMEKFDLSYRTLENKEISLVVERLPLDPANYTKTWEGIKEGEGCKEISMKFQLSSVPAGIPTWFIARSHRFTTYMHWRLGALFRDSKEERHLGLIEAYPHDRYLRLRVRGPVPYSFFALLRDGLELTLKRFPGVDIKRTMPCPGHGNQECSHEFDFRQLEKAFEREKMFLECPEALEDVSVPLMLFGLRAGTQDQVLEQMDILSSQMEKVKDTVVARIDDVEDELVRNQRVILNELLDLRELVQRGFTSLFNSEQRLAESHCPNVFVVLPKDTDRWLQNVFGQKLVLQLFCQMPGQWHPTMDGGRYEMRRSAQWLKILAPYILKLVRVIKYAVPLVGPIAGMVSGSFAEEFKYEINMMEALAKVLRDEGEFFEMELVGVTSEQVREKPIKGAALRALRKLLDEIDPRQHWGGLEKIFTPEGHYLWLCEYHAAEYRQ